MSSTIRLSDEQLSAIMRAAQPLAPADRGAFLQAVAAALRSHPEIGDGAVHRAVAEVQRQYFRPPLEGPGGVAKWSR
jgi:hypothetical protein